MTKWYSAKEAPNYEEWILTEWYDGDDGGLKYEADYLYSFVYWKDYVKRNNITKWCYIKDIKDRYAIRKDDDLEELINILALDIGATAGNFA